MHRMPIVYLILELNLLTAQSSFNVFSITSDNLLYHLGSLIR